MIKFVCIAVGGAVGAVLRYLVSGWAQQASGGVFPWGTLSVNLLGSFLIGFLAGFFESVMVSSQARIFLLIGVLGAFTTFSTFAIENVNLLRDKEYVLALTNILISNLAGICLVFAGYFLSRYLIAFVK